MLLTEPDTIICSISDTVDAGMNWWKETVLVQEDDKPAPLLQRKNNTRVCSYPINSILIIFEEVVNLPVDYVRGPGSAGESRLKRLEAK